MIEIRTLGSLEVRNEDGVPLDSVLVHPKRAALLVYLGLASPSRFVRRATLVGIFWPDRDEARAKASLKQELYQLRQSLGPEVFVARGDDEIGLNRAQFTFDVWMFEAATASDNFERAATKYGAPFLDGFFLSGCAEFDRWVETERDRLARAYTRVLEQLVDRSLARGEPSSAVTWARRLGTHQPYSTRAALRVMKLFEAVGDRAGALEYAEGHARRMRNDIGAEPSPDVLDVANRLRRHPVPVGTRSPYKSVTAPTAAGAPINDSFQRLKTGLAERYAIMREIGAGGIPETDHILDPMIDQPERLAQALADRYIIERELGTGGMANVYLAEDVKHKRKVAVKVLRPELAAILGAERFLKEIETTAKLQHPHILPLFDSGEADTFLYYVMPFIDGETLRDKLNREKQLRIDEAVRIATEVADALDYAHRNNIIHRDIKPENILLHDDRGLVADFGIALAVSAAADGRLTETGLSVGTPHYMSPEQATADQNLTFRSDIYSLGSVLYEMLTGNPPHVGSTAQAVIAAVVTEEPRPVTARRKNVAPHVGIAVHRALQKLPADRFDRASDFKAALTTLTVSSIGASGDTSARRSSATPGQWLWITITAVLFAVGFWLGRSTDSGARPSVHVSIPLAANVAMGPSAAGPRIAMSADGTRLVYVGVSSVGERQLYVRSLSDVEVRALPGTGGAYMPAFSPDGESVAFVTGDEVKRVGLAGGDPVSLGRLPRTVQENLVTGLSWGVNDTLYLRLSGVGFARLGASGGSVETMEPLRELYRDLLWPQVLPGAREILVMVSLRGSGTPALTGRRVGILSLESFTVDTLSASAEFARFSETGHLILVSAAGQVTVQAIDLKSREMVGEARRLLSNVLPSQDGSAQVAVSSQGDLVYVSGGGRDRSVITVDRSGNEDMLLSEPRAYRGPRLSPDGGRLVVTVTERANDLWLFDMAAATLSRFSFGGDNFYPEWTPDGGHILFTSRREGGGLYRKPSDGAGDAELFEDHEPLIFTGNMTPSGDTLVFRETHPETGLDIWIRWFNDGGGSEPHLATQFNESVPTLSPDGRWLAYVSDESGREEIYVRRFPGPGGKQQISLDGGTEPRWRRDSGELYYRNDFRMHAALVDTRTSFQVVRRTQLFEDSYSRNARWADYDVSADGQLFYMVKQNASSSNLMVMLNWPSLIQADEEVR